MNAISCDTLTESIAAQLHNNFEAYPVNDGCVIVTPYLHSDLANIEFLVEVHDNSLRLTDEGETLANLFVNGLTVEGNKPLMLEVARLAKAHGVQFQNSVLFVDASAEEIGQASQRLTNTIQAVTHLIYKRTHRRSSTFDDEVEKFLLEHRVKYEKNQKVQGATKSHRIPYYLNSNRNVFLQPVTARSTQSAVNKATSIAFQWTDLEKGNVHGNFTVLLDDRKKKWDEVWLGSEALVILQNYSTTVIRWESERFRLTELVTA